MGKSLITQQKNCISGSAILYICMYVLCMHVRMYIRMYVWMDGWMNGWIFVCSMYIYSIIIRVYFLVSHYVNQ